MCSRKGAFLASVLCRVDRRDLAAMKAKKSVPLLSHLCQLKTCASCFVVMQRCHP